MQNDNFGENTFEKAERLVRILEFINNTPAISGMLALKGGTAINLTVFNLPRLSVDIDLDFTENCNREEMMKVGGLTEVKAENTIKRSTSIANPRSNERVVRGAKFGVNWYYTMDRPEYLIEDMETLAEGCKLLSLDYLGGSGTRGYGRVEFDHFTIEVAYGKLPGGIDIEQLRKPFEDVNTYAVQGI